MSLRGSCSIMIYLDARSSTVKQNRGMQSAPPPLALDHFKLYILEHRASEVREVFKKLEFHKRRRLRDGPTITYL